MTTNDRRTIALVALAGIAILVALWMLAISPKREERAQVRDNVAAQQQRLQTAQTVLASYEAAKKQFPSSWPSCASSTRPCRLAVRSRRFCVSCRAARRSATASCSSSR